jgi:hypothetical protein
MDEVPEVTTRSRRSVIWTALGTIIVIVATLLYLWSVTYKPAYGADRTADKAITVSTLSNGQKMYTIHLNIQQVVGSPAAASSKAPVPSSVGGPNQAWLGYQTDTQYSGKAYPGTIFHLPKNALVTVIVHNFDSATAPRNPYFSLVQGTIGGVEYVNGKRTKVMNPDIMSHTFTIPDFGVSVPMEGIPDSGKPPYETMRFSFRTPNRTGVFRWQCIVPCGWGLYGFGGPMGELGYMQGQITLS